MLVKRVLNGGRARRLIVVALAVAIAAAALVRPEPALAHCDSVNGPVVNAARDALAKGDVKLILPYVQPDAEQELTVAFEQAVKVSKQGGDARKLAENYFFETAVRLHRIGEGAAYTGLNYESDFGPGLESAELALAKNSTADVTKLLEKALYDGIDAKWHAVKEARAAAARTGTVEAQRERAEAELLFEKYVFELYTSITARTPHAEGAAAAAPADHSH